MSSILVIEDNTEMRENIVEILQLAHYDVVTAANGSLGIELAMLIKPDLIISDIAMPEMDGWQVLKAIRHQPHTGSIPFIIITAKAEQHLEAAALELGASGFLPKPFEGNQLLKVTADCLNNVKG